MRSNKDERLKPNKNRDRDNSFDKIDMSDTSKYKKLAEEKANEPEVVESKPKAPRINVNKEIAERQAAMEAIKMKQGKMETEGLKDSEEVRIVPITKKQKWDNFWYHYKAPFWVILFVVVIGGMFLKDMIFKPKYDVDILMTASLPFSTERDNIVAGVNEYTEDFDGNGEASANVEVIQMMDMSSEEAQNGMDPQVVMANQAKLMASLTGFEYLIMITDDFNYDYLDYSDVKFKDLSEISDNPNVKGDRFYIKGTQFANSILKGYDTLLEDMSISIVDFDYLGDKYKEDEKFVQRYNEALKVITNIIEAEDKEE